MAESAKIIAPNVVEEKHQPITGLWYEWVIAAPGYRVVESISTTMAAFGGFVGGLLLAAGLVVFTKQQWILPVVLLIGPFAGAGYAKLLNRFFGNERLIARGRAARVLATKRNDPVLHAAQRDAPAYFQAAQRASELDEIERKLERKDLESAQRTVLQDELDQGAQELHLMLSAASLHHAAALLDPSDPAIRAAGHITAAMYAELQEGKAAAYDEDL